MQLNLAIINKGLVSPVGASTIRNIIFDFGGVICNIDVKLTEKAFQALGLPADGTGRNIAASSGLFGRLESGKITPEQFLDELRPHFPAGVTNDDLIQAWNALLLDIPDERIRLLESLRSNDRIFLLSNTNKIHHDCFGGEFTRLYGYKSFNDLFEKAYLSYQIGLKKPSPEIFRYVLENSHLQPEETLFIDDTSVHVEAARTLGIQAYRLAFERGEQITSLFH